MKDKISLVTSLVITGLFAAFVWTYLPGFSVIPMPSRPVSSLPGTDVEIPASWGDLGMRLAEAGVYDREKLLGLYESRGGLGPEERMFIDGINSGNIRMTAKNSGILLNLFWALGLGNKNEILEKGPMMDPEYGGADRFASTGGWSLAKGHPMEHYSMHRFIELTPEQQEAVERVSKGIFRPCCGNATHFPDCNHGMAMLGLLQLLAKDDASEAEMYRIALGVNRLWFPSQYEHIDQYLKQKGASLASADPKAILGSAYSSAQGYQRILAEITPAGPSGGASCGA